MTLQGLRGDLVQELYFGDAELFTSASISASRIDRGQDTVQRRLVGKIGGMELPGKGRGRRGSGDSASSSNRSSASRRPLASAVVAPELTGY